MKIAIINPHSDNLEIMHKCPPYGILSLISFLNKELGNQIDVKYFDDFLESDTKKNVSRYSPDLIGISSNTPTINRAYELADYFRKKGGNCVVLGGKHPSACPEESIRHADYVIIGEGENALVQLAGNLLVGIVPPENIIFSKVIMDLDSIPPLPWHILNRDYYLIGEDAIGSIIGFDKKGKSIGLLTSRGCPFKCVFCYNSKRNYEVRYHSPERVINDIKYMLSEWKVDSIFFFDDEFLSNRKRLREICSLIKEKGINFNWSCQARADVVDDEILELVKECGCIQIEYGLESGSPKILRFLKGRYASVDKNKRAIKMTKKVGIKVFSDIILGTPTENIIDFLRTFRFIMINPIDIVATSIATAYPGTKLWDYCVANNIIDPDSVDYERLSMQRNTYYLNSKFIPRMVFSILLFIYRGFIFLFRKDYSINEMSYRIRNKLFKKQTVL